MESMPSEHKRLLSIDEMADFLGVRPKTIYAWVHTRKIPHFKIGRLVKFDLNDIRAWLKERRVDARQEERIL